MTGLDDNAASGKLCHRPASKSVSCNSSDC